MTVIAQKCKKIGADLALITTKTDSPIGKLADYMLEVKAATTKVENNEKHSIQPGANTFEQSVLLIGDAIIINLMSTRSLTENNKVLMSKHANLE